MICMNFYNNRRFGLLLLHSGYGTFYLNSPKGYNRIIINAQTVSDASIFFYPYRLTCLLNHKYFNMIRDQTIGSWYKDLGLLMVVVVK